MRVIGRPLDRTDGALKVRGEARYAAEFLPAQLTHAVIVASTVAKGTIAGIDTAAAEKPESAGPDRPADASWGDADAAYAQAPVKFSATYTTPKETHNPMEPHATVAVWEGERLTLYDATQYVSGVRETVAKTLGIAQ